MSLSGGEKELELRERFQRSRLEDELQAPSFSAAWTAAAARAAARWRPPLWRVVPGAGLLLLILAVSVAMMRRASRIPVVQPAGVVKLADWRAPSDFLLQTPGREILTSVPRLDVTVPGVAVHPQNGGPKR